MGRVIKKAEAARVFTKLKVEPKKAGHHVRGFFVEDGRKILALRYSHGSGDMPANITDKFRTQLKLNEAQFDDLIRCPLDRLGFVNILRAKGFLDQ